MDTDMALTLTLTLQDQDQDQGKSGKQGPIVISVNPGSLLATKMVKEGFGEAGSEMGIGADILCRAALADAFAESGGKSFDNGAGRFGSPHSGALDAQDAGK